MEIKIGDYVRTKAGQISKVIDIIYNDNFNTEIQSLKLENLNGPLEKVKRNFERDDNGKVLYEKKKTIEHWFTESMINDSSENLADLAEIGDYITYKISNIYYNVPSGIYGRYNRKHELTELMVSGIPLKEVEIISIVTREQFEQMSYKVEQSE